MRRFLSWTLSAAFVLGLGLAPLSAADKPKPDLDATFKKLDANSDGKLTEEEFLGKRKGDAIEKGKMQFKRLDKNSDASLSLEEFKDRKKKAK